MTLLYFAAFFAVLGIVHIVLPYHIGMTGVCLLLLAAVLAALWLLKRKKARKGWSAALIALLVKHDVPVLECSWHHQSLEQYFFRKNGGE